MPDANSGGVKPEISLAEETELLDRAIWRKWNKFTWSGLILILVGVLLIGWGLALHMDPYSIAGVIAGIGVIIILIGVIRLLIGLINPRSPLELRGIDPPLSAEEGAED